jgi:hypothetical protein
VNEALPVTPWTELSDLVESYLDTYELCDAEDEDGNTGDYSPNDRERMLINDAVQGLIGDDEIIDKLIEAREYTRKIRREAGDCEECGAAPDNHWGNCKAARKLIMAAGSQASGSGGT